ncbi:MAG: hypothetical protein KBB21_04335 [Nannocystaceae bacterium]|nr:hypothetical protein [Nannocystaceae bacterium]
MATSLQRVLAAIGLVGVVLVGVWLSNKFPRESSARTRVIRSGERDVATVRASVAEQRAELEQGEGQRLQHLESLAQAWRVPMSAAHMAAPLVHAIELEDAIVLAPGKQWSSAHLRVTAVVERVTYRQHGVSVAANHTIARIENIGTQPVAYLVRASSAERGRCEVHGSRMHNAIALRPREAADVVLCAGSGSVRLEHVEVLEIDEFQQRLLSQLSPRALGSDDMTALAHQPFEAVESCGALAAPSLAGLIHDGTATWADLVDYYARHDCHVDAFVPGYHRLRPRDG